MTEERAPAYGDPMTAPFWAGANEGRLLIQKCSGCGAHQFYPRPFCLACNGGPVKWVEASGRGIVYTRTVVHMDASPELSPPYVVGVIELDEGPRITANITDSSVQIGDRVLIGWRHRENAPPFPLFRRQ